jgi:rare lipoprotein A
MRTGNRIQGLAPRSFASRSVQALVGASLLGLAPLAASSAAAPDAAATGIETAASSAVVELVPLQPISEITGAAPVAEQLSSPSAPQETVLGRGSASYYAAQFDGRRTASGERFDNDELTAAHRTLPFGSLVRVTNPANGRSVVVRINDRGPFTRGRLIDVSRAAAAELGLIARGHGDVELALISD